jgi:MtfA peptidase
MKHLIKLLHALLRRLAHATRVRLPSDPIPVTWPEAVARRVPLVGRLAPSDRDRLFRLMQLFLKEVPIEACGGLRLNEDIQVTIAAQASLLLLNMPYPRYNRARRILVYPRSFVPKTVRLHQTGELVLPERLSAGQAWQSGVIVLGWDDVQQGALSPDDGHNVVLHEFAHMLDAEDGRFDGVPLLDTGSAYRAWAALLSSEFAEHVRKSELGEPTVLDPYGAENRAEYFAVATEAFFETPVQLRADQPRLYELLMDFFKLDPVSLLAQKVNGAA